MGTKLVKRIYALLAAGTLITLFIVYKDIDHPYSVAFVIGYVIFLLLTAIIFIVGSLMKLVKLKRAERRKRLIKFLAYFAVFSSFAYLADYLFSSEIDLTTIITISLSSSFGLVFLDLLLFKQEN